MGTWKGFIGHTVMSGRAIKNVLNRSEPDLPECRSDQPHIAQLQTHSHDTALRLDVNT